MNEDDKQRAQTLVNRLLNEAADKTAAGEYKAALSATKKAKALDQSNVFLLALERQIEQIGELAITGMLTEVQRTDILDSIPRLVEQAVKSASAHGRHDQQPGNREETAEESEARIAAGRWLKNQYFQRAHEFVRTGEYDHALLELRKIFSIDAQDKVAREFEMKILQMLELRRRQPVTALPEVIPQTPPPAPLPSLAEPVAAAVVPLTPAKSRSLVPIAVIVTIIVAALAALYFWNRQQTPPAAPRVPEPIQEINEDLPIYPLPPQQIPSDTTKQDSLHTP